MPPSILTDLEEVESKVLVGDRRAWEEWAEEEEQTSAACPVVGPAEALKIGAHARLQAVL